VKVATIDIGTNSVLLLIAEETEAGLSPVLERASITRLGEGVDRTRELAPAARERTLACLADYAKDIAEHAPNRVGAVGTSAMRDARGGPEFAAEAQNVLGVRPLVIDGRREAELTFRGTLSGLAVGGPVAVFDVGGGSTEIVVGTVPEPPALPSIESATSLDIGSVRLFERHVRSDPPAPFEIDAVNAAVERALGSEPAIPGDATLVGVAGTVTTLAAIAGKIDPYDARRIHGVRLELETIRELVQRLTRATLDERKKLPGLPPRRADVIVAGALLVERFVTWSRKSAVLVSDRGVRWGLAEEMLREQIEHKRSPERA
jgi:exopolyphosphatase/guanosine-5'-triphosphate,3'-diphosphate pyrophosphatase